MGLVGPDGGVLFQISCFCGAQAICWDAATSWVRLRRLRISPPCRRGNETKGGCLSLLSSLLTPGGSCPACLSPGNRRVRGAPSSPGPV